MGSVVAVSLPVSPLPPRLKAPFPWQLQLASISPLSAEKLLVAFGVLGGDRCSLEPVHMSSPGRIARPDIQGRLR